MKELIIATIVILTIGTLLAVKENPGFLNMAMGTLSGINLSQTQPGVSSVTRTSELTVLVIGQPSNKTLAVLNGNSLKEYGIIYKGNINPKQALLDTLKRYSVVILEGDPYFDMNAREAARDYVNSGGKLVVVGDAGSKHPDYSNVATWAWPEGMGIPVPVSLVGELTGVSDIARGQNLRLEKLSHPIVKDLRIAGSKLDSNATVFKAISKGEVIIAIDTDEGTLPALVEWSFGSGKVLYFAYDPGESPGIFVAALAYLTGAASPAAVIDPKVACTSLCAQKLSAGENLTSGPCLSNNITPGWVCDVVHNPRQEIDDNVTNQCSEYNKTTYHFVEIDTECEFVREI